jgi:hypothetical protein
VVTIIQQSVPSTVDDLSFGVDPDQIVVLDEGKIKPKWVHPKGIRLYRVSQGDVSGDALPEPVLAKDPKSKGQTVLEELAFRHLVREHRRQRLVVVREGQSRVTTGVFIFFGHRVATRVVSELVDLLVDVVCRG